jgi:hypothetical protein
MRGRRGLLRWALLATMVVGAGGGAGPAASGSAVESPPSVRNGRLMVVAAVDGTRRDWFVDFYPDGSHVRRASTANLELFGVEYSPDGQSLVVFANDDPTLSRSQVYRARSDGSGLQQLTEGPNDWSPTWSPNGQRIAYVHNYDLTVMRADGTRKRSVFPWSEVESVTWGADGRLVFTAWSDFDAMDSLDRPDLWSVSPDGSDLQRLTNTADVAEYTPDPSPNADLIAYEHRSGGAAAPITVHVMNRDGTGDRELAEGSAPEWSPDGKWVAYATSGSEGYSVIGFVRPDGTDGRKVVLDNAIPDAPTWRAKLTFSWQPWPGATPSRLRDFRVRAHSDRTALLGRVDPSLPWHRVRATLRRPTADGQAVMATRDKLTDDTGRFRVQFPRTGRTGCELIVRYTGDAAHLPSHRAIDIPC